jgi:phosphate transport system protein
VVEMGAAVVKALEQSVHALVDKNVDIARAIIENDFLIDDMETKIIKLSTVMIAEEQPVARDLRTILGSMRIAHDLERIADNAVHVSKSTLLLAEEEYLKPISDLPKMAEISIGMVRDAVDNVINQDVESAREICTRDKNVDDIYADDFKKLISLMHKNPPIIEQALSYLFICRRLERVADHATHICEDVVYIKSGERVPLNL